MWAWPCTCCAKYSVRQFDNSSTFTLLAQRDTGFAVGAVSENGSSVYAQGTIQQSSRLTLSLAVDQQYNASPEIYFSSNYNPCVDGSGNWVFPITQVLSGKNLLKRSPTDTAVWSAAMDFSSSAAARVAIDSSGNLYVFGSEGGGPSHILYKFNSSGSKLWKISPPNNFPVSSAATVFVIADSSDYCWAAYNQNGVTARLVRFDTSGSVVTNISPSGTIKFLRSDGGTGVWICHNTNYFSRYDSSGSVVTTWQETALSSPVAACPFAVDASNNLYCVVTVSSDRRIRKFNSSGTVQWTSPSDIGWTSAFGSRINDVWANSSYVYVAGDRMP